jgi:hypothetical protein
MGLTHDEWQRGLGRAVLAKRASGQYAAGIGGVIVSICRQVGKTFTFGSIIFALCVLFPGMKVLWTAHRTRTSSETFRSMKGMAARKLVAPHVEYVRSTNGEQEIGFRNGSRILFGARESGFGRGFDDVDAVVFDEAQILTEKALDDMVPATAVAKNALVVFIGTPPKPSDPSEVFTGRRKECITGMSEDTLFVEISADADADLDDRAQWRKGNPSYPHRTPEQAILRMKRQLGDESFRREGLGIWDTGSGSVIPPTLWSKCLDSESKIAGVMKFVLDVSPSRSWSSIAVAGYRADELPHLEITSREGVLDHRPDAGWVVDRATELRDKWPGFALTIVSGAAAEALVPALTAASIPLEFVKSADVPAACGLFYDRVTAGTVRHIGQSVLTDALKGARKNIDNGEGAWRWGRRKSSADITPLYAGTVALWALLASPPVEPSIHFL